MVTVISVVGSSGRMGKQILKVILDDCKVKLSGALVRKKHCFLGKDVGESIGFSPSGILYSDQSEDVVKNCNVLIDFSLPCFSIEKLSICVKYKKPIIIGTTGFSEEQLEYIKKASKKIPVLYSPNMSIGVNLLFQLVKIITTSIGNISDIEISEAHHRNKIDSPSGTALKMGEIVAEQLGLNFDDVAIFNRQGMNKRKKHTVGFSVVRAGNIIGNHTALFGLEGEELEISHKANNRNIYAKGAVMAAKWIVHQNNGFYSMQDMLDRSFFT